MNRHSSTRLGSTRLASTRLASTRLGVALSLSLGLAACGAAGTEATPEEYVGVDQADLTAAEVPTALTARGQVALTDAELATPEATRFAADATLAADGDVASLLPADDPGAASTRRSLREVVVAVRWGYFPARAADTWIDWSGFVAISRGQVEVIRPLRFENDHDGDTRPNEDFLRRDADPRLVRFRSHTRPAWDGVLLRIRRPSLAPSVVVLQLGSVTRVLPFEELLDLDASETVDAAGHELRIRSRAVAALHPCVDELASASGRFDVAAGSVTGTIDAAAGTIDLAGHMLDVRGPYGLVSAQLTDASGANVGTARGLYASFHYAPGGLFATRVRDAGDDLRGALAGRFDAEGHFDARVIARCDAP
jgi:hypothetical protein